MPLLRPAPAGDPSPGQLALPLCACRAPPAVHTASRPPSPPLSAPQATVAAAHVCYLLGGCAPSFYDPPDPTPNANANTSSAASAGAGAPMSASPTHPSPPCRLVLVGTDPRSCPRTYCTPLAVQRAEILEWARAQAAGGAGGGGPGGADPGLAVSLLPYKLWYAQVRSDAAAAAAAAAAARVRLFSCAETGLNRA